MAEPVTLAEPYATRAQQHRADVLGMYVFLATETMLFGALIAVVQAYRGLHHAETSEAARHLNLVIATANTALLLTSSLFVALAVEASKVGRRGVAAFLGVAVALGLGFLVLKGVEYGQDWREGLIPHLGADNPIRHGPAALFLDLYLIGTALHAVHMLIGLALLGWVIWRVGRGRTRLPGQAVVVEMAGLYWHFVDIVWVFLFPIFYLSQG